MSNRLKARASRVLHIDGLTPGKFRNDASPSLADVANAMTSMNRAFEAFKAKNDESIAELKKNRVDAVTTEHVDRINADISRLNGELSEMAAKVAAARTATTGNPASPEVQAHAKAFNAMIRKGKEDGVHALAVKAALTTDSDPDGGYVVPEEVNDVITRVLGINSAMRGLASVVTPSAPVYKHIVNLGGAGSGWVGEKGSRTETATPTLSELSFPTMELYAMPAATQAMLDDASINVESWLGEEIGIQFAEKEGDAFINGDGVNKPRGFLTYTKAASTPSSPSAWGKIGFTKTGVAGGYAADPNGGDKIIDLIHSLKPGYRANANFMMNESSLARTRKLKDSNGEYIWQPSFQLGQPSLLCGYGVITDDNMPDFTDLLYPVAFGDFNRGYLIVDRVGVRVLRDPYSSKPYVLFYTTKRVGGGVKDYHAIKLLQSAV